MANGAAALAQPVDRAQIIDKIVAKVDNQIVLASEVETSFLQALETNRGEMNLRCKVFEGLVINKLLLAKAELDSVKVDPKMVEEQLDRRMNIMVQSVGGREKVEELYNKTVDQLKSELRKSVRDMMVINKMRETISKGAKVTPGEVKAFFSAIPKDSLPFYSKEVEVAQIVRMPKAGKTRKTDAKARLEKLRERILKGENFETIAQVYSDDPGSAIKGGALGYVERGVMVPEFEATALRLKVNEISEVFESQFGYHIVQLLDRRGTEYNSRHILVKPEASEEDRKNSLIKLDSIRNAIYDDSISWESAARKYSEDAATKNNGGFFQDPVTSSIRVPIENLDPAVFFVIDSMENGEISAPHTFKTEDCKEGVRIIYYRSYIPPHVANLKDDYQKLQADALQEKQQGVIEEWFNKARKEVFISVAPEYVGCDLFKDFDRQ